MRSEAQKRADKKYRAGWKGGVIHARYRASKAGKAALMRAKKKYRAKGGVH